MNRPFTRFEDLLAWQEGRQLNKQVISVTKLPQVSKDFIFCDQIRRASLSITTNIAEGFERDSNKEFIYFLAIAKGSAGEVRSLLYAALDEGYINNDQFSKLFEQANKVIKLVNGLIQHLKKSNYKGRRYKPKQP